MIKLPLEGAQVYYYKSIIEKEKADEYLNLFTNTFDLTRRKVTFKNDNNESKTGKLNRATCAFGDKSVEKYPSIWGDDLKLSEWTPEMLEIKKKVEEITKHNYNICLCNYYSTSNRTIGWHADREELGDTQSIASISFGGKRTFEFRKKGEIEPCYSIVLESGSLLWMGPGTQENYEHQVSKGGEDERINLTFRKFHSENYSKDLPNMKINKK